MIYTLNVGLYLVDADLKRYLMADLKVRDGSQDSQFRPLADSFQCCYRDKSKQRKGISAI